MLLLATWRDIIVPFKKQLYLFGCGAAVLQHSSGGAWPQFMKAFSLQCNNVRTSGTNRNKPKQQSFVRCTLSRSKLGIKYRKFSESYFKMSVVQRKNDKGRNLVNFNTVWILTDEKIVKYNSCILLI